MKANEFKKLKSKYRYTAYMRPFNLLKYADNSTNASTIYHWTLPLHSNTVFYHFTLPLHSTTSL